MRAFLSLLLVLLGLAAAGVYLSFFIVHQNELALVVRFGDPRRVIKEPGLNWKMPLVETVEIFDRRLLDLETMPQEVTASDTKRLMVDSFARYRILDPLKYFQTLRDERIAKSRLGTTLDSSVRLVLGSATFTDVVRDKREALMNDIQTRVNAEAKDYGIEVVDVRIKRADLPEQNSKSVFGRMRAEREREAQEFRSRGTQQSLRIKAEADRMATITKAEATRDADKVKGEGEGEANRIFGAAFGQDPDFSAFYRSMQAYETSMENGKTRMLLSPDSEFFRYFNNPSGGSRPQR